MEPAESAGYSISFQTDQAPPSRWPCDLGPVPVPRGSASERRHGPYGPRAPRARCVRLGVMAPSLLWSGAADQNSNRQKSKLNDLERIYFFRVTLRFKMAPNADDSREGAVQQAQVASCFRKFRLLTQTCGEPVSRRSTRAGEAPVFLSVTVSCTFHFGFWCRHEATLVVCPAEGSGPRGGSLVVRAGCLNHSLKQK